MDVLTVGGKEYVKASVIARELGYTADYVGQLCRSHRVRAKLVGRSWFVDRDSIAQHKTTRYRSTQTKAKESLKEEVRFRLEQTANPVQSSPHYYRTTGKPSFTYVNDESELIPIVQKTPKVGTLAVGLADAVPVSVTSDASGYRMNAPKLPVIRFRGSLKVSEISEDELIAKEGERIIHPKEVQNNNSTKKNIVISSKPALEEKEKTTLIPPKTARAIRATKTVTLKKDSSEVRTQESDDTKAAFAAQRKNAPDAIDGADVTTVAVVAEEGMTLSSKVLIVSTCMFSFFIALALLGLETSYTVDGQSITASYRFTIDHLAASVYSSAADVNAIFDLFKFSTNFFIF